MVPGRLRKVLLVGAAATTLAGLGGPLVPAAQAAPAARTASAALPEVRLMVSSSPDRASARPLSGALVKGRAYVFVSPAQGIREVAMGGLRETAAPFDYAGTGAGGLARPWDSTTRRDHLGMLSDGPTVFRATVTYTNGQRRLLYAEADVANTLGPVTVQGRMRDVAAGQTQVTASWPAVAGADGYEVTTSAQDEPDQVVRATTWTGVAHGPDEYLRVQPVVLDAAGSLVRRIGRPASVDLDEYDTSLCDGCPAAETPRVMVATKADRSDARPLQGATLSGRVYVFVPALARRPDSLYFTLDFGSSYGTFQQFSRETAPPYDLMQTAADGTGYPLDLGSTLRPGKHVITTGACYPDSFRGYCNPRDVAFTVTG